MSCCSRRKYSKGAKAASQQKSRGSRSFMKARLYCLCQRPGICRRCIGCSACFTLNNKRSNKPGRSFLPGSLPKNPRVDKGPQPLVFNPALTTQGELPRWGKRRPPGGCASERMKTQRFSYFADFAARERMREAKPVKLKDPKEFSLRAIQGRGAQYYWM